MERPYDGDDVIEENQAAVPFSDSLQPTNFDVGNVTIWQIKGQPNILVRENGPEEGQTADELEASIREGKAHFQDMRERYGIRIVSMQPKKAVNKAGAETVFTIVDKIDGQNLSRVEHLPPEAAEELDTLYGALARHYLDAWNDGTPYWGDCRSDQFVYGTKHGEDHPHCYVVDVDSKFYREGDDRFSTIEAALGSLSHDLVEIERTFTPSVRLQKARDELNNVIDTILAEEPELHMLCEAKTWLRNTTNQ